jgi:hypothetical protein
MTNPLLSQLLGVTTSPEVGMIAAKGEANGGLLEHHEVLSVAASLLRQYTRDGQPLSLLATLMYPSEAGAATSERIVHMASKAMHGKTLTAPEVMELCGSALRQRRSA